MRVLITAGGTREYIDPVRFISNASSGRMSYALTRAALKAGHKVTLITTVDLKSGIVNQAKVVKVESATEMFEAVKKHFEKCDCLIMAAAVADYTPAKKLRGKIKKQEDNLTIKLKLTPDILKWAGKNKKIKGKKRIVIGFALEDKNLLQNAEKKLKEKNLDMIVANDISAIGNEKSTLHIKLSGKPWQQFIDTKKLLTAKRIINLIEDSVF